ncbi:hypothetical protein [Pseudogracilibacillus sp. SO30301A]|uniref:hypothetical protein n=1 Tax=Pseudogracilibacillus sp. SO30301A TaxID=3098291 RepID=UPI00300E6695
MFLKTKSIIDNVGHVHFINGFASFGNVKLNVYCFEVDGVLIDTGAQSLLTEGNRSEYLRGAVWNAIGK